MNNQAQYDIGLVIFPEMTQLDITGPHQVFSFIPNARIHWVWKTLEPVKSNDGMTILPTTTFDACPPLDIFCVPGGPGQINMMQDTEVLEFLKQQSKTAKYITSVCTGSLILAAAGLLQGYRAACHWLFLEQLAMLGVEVGTERVIIDRNRITGGGVTAGIDFGLVVVGELCGEDTAKMIQLLLQYDPAPPFNAGIPQKAGEAVVQQVKKLGEQLVEASLAQTKRAAAQLSIDL
ncbi:DJ-1/PfpI family protein [Aetokthonos hydrillicola Thurmond2011]|jgi:cyclohexyl-isocyanide hydratase|uniref:DJ-1/PfpI family protein n=1 Tax=Aetokthonos hydrillicola Thurmond2011 TaxID=2712845 RepID=A0AAP5IBU5_9CYAN|nr:DJ-1/PfpI family protein [Aetokthonos hydrillicola]MBO3460404.1 DJ-1/PfpI family protein [Aetokthonos hydrillicola CCALA 1050]MBW4588520.1 DJ-1/PfpI family protein [Aetokthonos hydrillicola CCALA 1050]MDR9896848.1 DJ-1/PfpI family protein [Aetokthonos hydrillicola Thurmond2011]